MTFTIPYPKTKGGMKQLCKQFGLNALYAGKHWAQRKKDADYWHFTVQAELIRQNVFKKPCVKPVTITFYWNDRLDIDNHSYMGKMIVDAIKGWIIAEDDRQHVKSVCHRFYDGDCITVEVKTV